MYIKHHQNRGTPNMPTFSCVRSIGPQSQKNRSQRQGGGSKKPPSDFPVTAATSTYKKCCKNEIEEQQVFGQKHVVAHIDPEQR
jgi:hypothetical protein